LLSFSCVFMGRGN